MPSKATRDPRKTAWGRGADLKAEERWLTLAPRKSHLKKLAIAFNRLYQRRTYQATQDRQRSTNKSHECKCDNNGRVGRGILEDVVDLGLLAVSRELGGRYRHVGVAIDRQLESGGVICIGVSKPTNDHMGINGIGEREELNRKLLLGLGPLLAGRAHAKDPSRIPNPALTFHCP